MTPELSEAIKPSFFSVACALVACLLFLLPGWMMSRRFPTPLTPIAVFLGSAALLFQLVLVFDTLEVPLHFGALGLTVAAISVALALRLPRRPPTKSLAIMPALKGTDLAWLIPPIMAVASIAIRSMIDPLSGYDNGTRWDYLARLIRAQQSLAGYPPVTAEDFELYSWCDGIPPLVSLLNFWLYSGSDSVAPALTALMVIGEALLLGTVVFRFSQLLWGSRAGWPAVATLSSSALAIWSTAMGQETGMTALSLVSMLYFLELHSRAPATSVVLWAAVAAAVGALTREYGLSFPILGLAILIFRKQSIRTLLLFTGVTVSLAAPWYVRNWVLTGNPLYPQTLGGLFPGNAAHDDVMRTVITSFSLPAEVSTVIFFGKLLLTLAGALVSVSLFFVCRRARVSKIVICSGIGLTIAIWLWSIPQTAGGWSYSARVLAPALALAAVIAGGVSTIARRSQNWILILLIVFSVDAARRSWGLPLLPFISPWSLSFAGWREVYSDNGEGENPVWRNLVGTADGGGIVVDHTINHLHITLRGGRAIPLFSPLLAPTFEPDAQFQPEIDRLRAAGVRFITFSQQNPLSATAARHPFWSELYLHRGAIAQVNALVIYDLNNLPRVDPSGTILSQ